jgi:ParB/RepB/Spo0J family partition protein
MAKTKSFLSSRTVGPASASDADFEAVVGLSQPTGERPLFSQNLPLERIRPNPFQARQQFDGLDELADTIRTQGFISRLRVRPDPAAPGENFFQLVYGERRLRAALLAGLSTVPCDVAEYSDREMLEIGLAENIQRQDLNPLEEAVVFQRLTQAGEYSIRELAGRIGKNKDYVDGRLALLRAPQDVQELVAKRPDTVTVARRIATLESPGERRPLIEAVLEGTLNKEAVREIILELQTLVMGPVVAEALEAVPVSAETAPESHNHLDVRPDGQSAFIEPSEAPRRANKSSQYSSVRRINQETSMVLSILNRWLEMETAIWLTNQENLGRSIQAIRDTLLELVEHLAEVREVSLGEK